MSFSPERCIYNKEGIKMDSQTNRIRALLQKFLRNECDEAEMRELLEYLNSQKGISEAEREMDERFLIPASISIPPEISDRILDRLKSSTGLTAESTKKSEEQTRSIRFLFRMAASVAGFLLITGLIYFMMGRESAEVYVTEASQKRTVILSDGSLVTLNGGSTLSFNTKGKRREARLSGEAYFDVKHIADRPFYVNTSQIEIKVLGTAFNVKSYSDEDAVETTLIRGKVTVKNLREPNQSQPIELTPNEQAVFNKTTYLLSKTVPETDSGTAWRKGILVFEDEPVKDILAEIGKWYNVDFTLEEQPGDCRFNIFIENETLDEVLQLFEGIQNARVTRNGKRITIDGKLCQ
jgi:transmembrane sensor